MDNDLAALEQRLSTLLAHTRSLRVANETLRGELAQMQARNRELALRVQQASVRLDALLARIPAE
jgi:regulator of replication initiation timing